MLAQVGLHPLEVLLHLSGIGALRKLVFQVALVIDHIGEEALTHVGIAHGSEHHQHRHHNHHRAAVVKAEMHQTALQPVNLAAVGIDLGRRRFFAHGSQLEHAVRHKRHVDQSQNPTQEERHGQDDEEVAHVDAGRIGRKEDGIERQNRNHRGAEQRHRRTLADVRHGGQTGLFGVVHIHQDAVDDHDGIVHQHTHGQDESGEGDALHRALHEAQEQKTADDDDTERGADDDAALDAHEEHQDDHHNHHTLDEVRHEGAKRINDTLRLIEHLVHLNAGGETRGAQLLEALLDGGAHLGDVGLGRSGYQNAQGTLSVVSHGITHRFLDALLHLGNVRDAQLVHLMTLDEHAADIAHCLELVRHSDAHTLVSVIVIAGI